MWTVFRVIIIFWRKFQALQKLKVGLDHQFYNLILVSPHNIATNKIRIMYQRGKSCKSYSKCCNAPLGMGGDITKFPTVISSVQQHSILNRHTKHVERLRQLQIGSCSKDFYSNWQCRFYCRSIIRTFVFILRKFLFNYACQDYIPNQDNIHLV